MRNATLILLAMLFAVGGVLLLTRPDFFEQLPFTKADTERVLRDGVPKLIEVATPLVRPQPMRTIYLNREGATLTAGADDSSLNRSSIVANMGVQEAVIPPFASTPARFSSIAKCIRSKFADFDVKVVEQRPVGVDYVMVMLGGTIDVLGDQAKTKHTHAYGLSPYNGQAIADPVVLVFSRSMKESTVTTCETAAMEIAHAYGLDHGRNCRDLMTYMSRCGTRRFVDKDIPCGEHKDRDCGDGKPTQNSYAMLMELLGPSPEAAKRMAKTASKK